MQREVGYLQWLLDYELRCCERYRRFVSIVYVKSNGGARFPDVCGDLLRRSDELVDMRPASAVIMSETNADGALLAVSRFKSRCDAVMDLRYAVAAYPADGRTADDLLTTAQNRLEQAKGRERGAVVWSSMA